MRTLILSFAALALAGTAAPALAKPGHGHGRGHQDRGAFDFGRGLDSGPAWQRNRSCPPGLARKNNGCLPPGQARHLGIGDRLPSALAGYNVPLRYRDRYRDNADNLYRYDDNAIYRVDRRSGLIEDIISVLGL